MQPLACDCCAVWLLLPLLSAGINACSSWRTCKQLVPVDCSCTAITFLLLRDETSLQS
jgi:hypothetical protein